MKRRLLIIGILLLLGAVVNVAVAWALALCIHFEPNSNWRGFSVTRSHRALPEHRADGGVRGCSLGEPTHWQVLRLERTGSVLAVVALVGHLGPLSGMPFEEALPPVRGLAEEMRLIEESSPLNWDTLEYFVWDGRGWPCISMSCRWPWWQRSMWPRVSIEDGFRFGSPTEEYPWLYGVHQLRGLPLKPIWPGFAVNTLFYGTILWLLIAGPFALRRFLRLRRGLCPKCAYPMGESVVCTECGRLLPSLT